MITLRNQKAALVVAQNVMPIRELFGSSPVSRRRNLQIDWVQPEPISPRRILPTRSFFCHSCPKPFDVRHSHDRLDHSLSVAGRVRLIPVRADREYLPPGPRALLAMIEATERKYGSIMPPKGTSPEEHIQNVAPCLA